VGSGCSAAAAAAVEVLAMPQATAGGAARR
jgi:hypothetical protein